MAVGSAVDEGVVKLVGRFAAKATKAAKMAVRTTAKAPGFLETPPRVSGLPSRVDWH